MTFPGAWANAEVRKRQGSVSPATGTNHRSYVRSATAVWATHTSRRCR